MNACVFIHSTNTYCIEGLLYGRCLDISEDIIERRYARLYLSTLEARKNVLWPGPYEPVPDS